MPAAIAYAGAYLLMNTGAVAAGAFLLGNATLIGTALLVVGGMAYSASEARKAKSQARDKFNASQVDRMATVSSAVAPRELVMGRVRKSGTVFYKASTGAMNRSFFMAIALAGHEIDAVETIYFNDVAVTLDGTGLVTSGQYANHAQVWTYLGAAGQSVNANLNSAFPTDWPSTHTVAGVAYMVVHLFYDDAVFTSGIPDVTAVIRGAKLYDPRTTLTTWSENPALMMRHVYQHGKFGKASVTAAEDARFAAAANACDASTVYTVGGVAQAARALYKAALVVPFGAPAKGIFDDLSQSMGGSWAFAGGEFYVKPGSYTAPVLTLTDADLAVVQRDGAAESQRPISISTHRARNDKFNTVKATIWDVAADYKQTTLTPLVGSALVTRDGAELVQEVSMPAIGYAPQALHVAGIMMRDARDPLTLELPFKMRAYPVELFDTVSLTLTRYGWSAKTFMVLGRTFAADGSLLLTLKETTAAIVTLDADFTAQGYASNTNLPKPWEVQPVGTLTISSGTTELLKQSDGTIVSRMRVSWAQVPDAAVVQNGQVEVQYRPSSSSGAWASLVTTGNETTITTADVLDGETYSVRARAKSSISASAWGSTTTHTVLGKTEAPPPFDIFTVITQPDGTRQYNFGYSTLANQPADWLGAEIRYTAGTVGSPTWASMTPLQDTTTYYTSSPVELNAPLSGEWTFACKSLDTTGNESTYLVASTTLPDRRLGNVFAEYYEHVEGWLGTKTSAHVQQGYLEANDSTTWASLTTWTAWTRWNTTPASPITYETPARDFGTIVAGQINSTVNADGTVTTELATSADGVSWGAWGSAAAAFASRYIKLRITVSATGPAPVPLVREWVWQVNAPMQTEYINDLVISGLTGSYRIGTGDIRIPLAGTYTVLKRTDVVIQDSSAGAWTFQRIDQALTYGPRYQFKLNGTLADPSFVDFYIEGY